MSDFSQFFPTAGGGGGLKPKFQDFTTSGLFAATADLISAGGFIQVLVVGGGGKRGSSKPGSGGEAQIVPMYLTNTNTITVTIGAGATSSSGSQSQFLGSSAGGINITSVGGSQTDGNFLSLSPSWGGNVDGTSSGNGVFGYGAGASQESTGEAGVRRPKPNSGQGGNGYNGASGFVRVMWYE